MTLINTLKNNKNMRTIFGKQELKIIEKQLLGINLSPSERTRLSRDIRKKMQAIRKISQYENMLDLKKGAEIKYLIEDAKEEILKSEYFPRIKKIFLFGSTVTNQRTFRSDIDIAVEFDNISLRDATKFRIHIAGRVSEKIDIQVYNTLPEKIVKEINEKGKLIWKIE